MKGARQRFRAKVRGLPDALAAILEAFFEGAAAKIRPKFPGLAPHIGADIRGVFKAIAKKNPSASRGN